MVFRLPQRLQASQVEGVLEELKALPPGGPVEVDVSQVEKIDTAGVQLLLSLAITHRPVAWLGASKALSAAAELLGLRTSLGLPLEPQ